MLKRLVLLLVGLWNARLILLVVCDSLLAAMIVTAPATAASDVRAPALSRVASSYVAGANVYSHRFGDMTAGEAMRPGTILLAPDLVAALRAAPRIITPSYPRMNSGQAVFTLAHEIGHLTGRDASQWEEARADCWAAARWRTVARQVGLRQSQLAVLARQIDMGVGAGKCWGPQAGT